MFHVKQNIWNFWDIFFKLLIFHVISDIIYRYMEFDFLKGVELFD